MKADLIPGHASRPGTEAYARTFGRRCPPEHFSEFLNFHLKLSSLGLGTFPGAATPEVDRQYVEIISRALLNGINVIDTAAHYRFGRSAEAVGDGLRAAMDEGVSRDQVFILSKGGFISFAAGLPEDFDAWFEREIAGRGLGTKEDLAPAHLLSPEYLAFQLEQSRRAIGVETLDAFLVDQPEVHIPVAGKERLLRKLERAFGVLEEAVRDGKLRSYGISTFDAFRVETDHPFFLSLTSLVGLAEKAAKAVQGAGRANHHFKVVQLPFNEAMLEGFTRFNHATGQGNIASTLQAAFQLKVFAMGSHGLLKGHLASRCEDAILQAMPELANDAQRAMQFNRSTPGLGTSLMGISTPAHLDDMLAVAQVAPLERAEYLKLYERAQ